MVKYEYTNFQERNNSLLSDIESEIIKMMNDIRRCVPKDIWPWIYYGIIFAYKEKERTIFVSMDTLYYVVNRLVYSRGGYSYPLQRPQVSLIGVFDDEEKARNAMKENAVGVILQYGNGPQHTEEGADEWFDAFFTDEGRRNWEYSDEIKFISYNISTTIIK